MLAFSPYSHKNEGILQLGNPSKFTGLMRAEEGIEPLRVWPPQPALLPTLCTAFNGPMASQHVFLK